MNTYKEIKQIAKCVSKLDSLINKIEDNGFEDYGINFYTAEFVTLSKKDIEYFKSIDGETEDYFVNFEDFYSGSLYFKTDVPGQYVKFSFSC